MRQHYENWLRVVVLINYAGKRLCYEILHVKEELPCDGEQLYCKLEPYKNKMHFQIHAEILCPSNEVIDEKKFDLLVYRTVIYYMFGDKYKKVLRDVRNMRNEIFHMQDESICKADFEQLWNGACDMLLEHDFDLELLKILKTCDLFSVEEYRGYFIFHIVFINTHPVSKPVGTWWFLKNFSEKCLKAGYHLVQAAR